MPAGGGQTCTIAGSPAERQPAPDRLLVPVMDLKPAHKLSCCVQTHPVPTNVELVLLCTMPSTASNGLGQPCSGRVSLTGKRT